MQNNYRQFYIYDLEIAARKKGATVPTMDEIVTIFQRMKNLEKTYPINSENGTMLIGDIQIDNSQNFITLLIRLSDKSAPNAVYSDPSSGHFDILKKQGNQGSDFGCHVIVSTKQEKHFPNIYTCAIERVPGLSSSLVQRLLSKLLNYEFNDDDTSFKYPHPAGGLTRQGQPRMDRCCPHIELRGRPSDTLINDINNGQITGISLVKAEAVTPIAGSAYLRKKETELRLQIDQSNLPANMWQMLIQSFKANSVTYGKAKVSYKIPGNKKTVTVQIDTDTGNPIGDLYVKFFDLKNIHPFLDQSAKQVVDHLRDLAAPHFLNHRTI